MRGGAGRGRGSERARERGRGRDGAGRGEGAAAARASTSLSQILSGFIEGWYGGPYARSLEREFSRGISHLPACKQKGVGGGRGPRAEAEPRPERASARGRAPVARRAAPLQRLGGDPADALGQRHGRLLGRVLLGRRERVEGVRASGLDEPLEVLHAHAVLLHARQPRVAALLVDPRDCRGGARRAAGVTARGRGDGGGPARPAAVGRRAGGAACRARGALCCLKSRPRSAASSLRWQIHSFWGEP